MSKKITLTPEQLETLFRNVALALTQHHQCPNPAYAFLDEENCLSNVWVSGLIPLDDETPHPVYGKTPFNVDYHRIPTCKVCIARALFIGAGVPLPEILPESIRTEAQLKKAKVK